MSTLIVAQLIIWSLLGFKLIEVHYNYQQYNQWILKTDNSVHELTWPIMDIPVVEFVNHFSYTVITLKNNLAQIPHNNVEKAIFAQPPTYRGRYYRKPAWVPPH